MIALRSSTGKLTSAAIMVGVALLIVLILLGVILVSIEKDPALALRNFVEGAVGSDARRSDVLMMALPMLLCASGLLLTFTAGLWNIGVEGQVTMGAIFATIIARGVPENNASPFALPGELFLAMIGGALWAALAAILKTRGNVNEIFGGVALNFISQNILIFLVSDPWKSGTYPQTAAFKDPAMLPRLTKDLTLSLPAIVIAVVGFLVVFMILRGTRWGLQLKAMGRSQRSAFLLGVRTERNVVLSMMVCGALAGLAGAFLILSPISRGRLVSGASGGLGFLGVLIVLLVNVQAPLIPLVALFFAVVPIGSLKLQNAMTLDPSLGNVFQSALVLAVLLVNGVRTRLHHNRGES
ncbi:MAG: ABC transporter permease [Anaerolineae bacterium]|nr:ABC transporter permease [Anaerolineae bacterium]